MMMSKHAGRGNGRKEEKKNMDKPRKQKQPNGNSIRRRAPLRRRTVRQRLDQKQVLYPNRSHGYQQQAALDREVRGIFTRRPEDAHGTGLSGPDLQHLETMLRGDGGWGLAVVVSSMLHTIATIASDMATMIQIVSMDMDRDGDTEEIAPMPTCDTPAPGSEGCEPVGDNEDGDDDHAVLVHRHRREGLRGDEEYRNRADPRQHPRADR